MVTIKSFFDIMEVKSIGPGNIVELIYPKDHPKYEEKKFIWFSPGDPSLVNIPFLINKDNQVLLKSQDRVCIFIKLVENKEQEEEIKNKIGELI